MMIKSMHRNDRSIFIRQQFSQMYSYLYVSIYRYLFYRKNNILQAFWKINILFFLFVLFLGIALWEILFSYTFYRQSLCFLYRTKRYICRIYYTYQKYIRRSIGYSVKQSVCFTVKKMVTLCYKNGHFLIFGYKMIKK